MKKVQLNIGCGANVTPGFINVDAFFTEKNMKALYKARGEKYPKDAPFVQASILDLPFQTGSVDYIEMIDMVEHIPMRHLARAFSEVYRVLKPSCEVCIMTTDFDDVARMWLEASKELMDAAQRGEDTTHLFEDQHILDAKHLWPQMVQFKVNLAMMTVYGNQFHAGEFHASAFNPAIMRAYFLRAGFLPENLDIRVFPRGTLHPEFPAFGKVPKGTTLLASAIVARARKGKWRECHDHNCPDNPPFKGEKQVKNLIHLHPIT